MKEIVLNIGGSYVYLEQLDDGSWVCNLQNAAKTLGKSHQSVVAFLKVRSPYKVSGAVPVSGWGYKYSVIHLDTLKAYWLYQAQKGNIKAMRLALEVGQESLGDHISQHPERTALNKRIALAQWKERHPYASAETVWHVEAFIDLEFRMAAWGGQLQDPKLPSERRGYIHEFLKRWDLLELIAPNR